jgi:hypothetical protein
MEKKNSQPEKGPMCTWLYLEMEPEMAATHNLQEFTVGLNNGLKCVKDRRD